MFKTKVRQVLRYWNRFGFVSGSRIFINVLLNRSFIRLPLPGYEAPIFARRDTSDVFVFEQVFVDQGYDFPLVDLEPGLIIDAGANVGYASVFFAHRYPAARILALEPESSNYELLLRNTAPYQNIEPIKAALWNKTGRVVIGNPESEKWAFRVTNTGPTNGPTIEALTMEDLMAIGGTEHVDILKLDIEGAEKELFESNYEAWLGNVRVLMIELHDQFVAGCSGAFNRAVGRYQFNQSIKCDILILVKY